MQVNNIPPSFQPPRYSYEDFKNWSGDWELIYGYPFSLFPSPKRKHQSTNGKFNRFIGNALAGNACECEIYLQLDWIINQETVVRPDSMIVCGEFNTDFLTFPPTLILEVSSVSTWMKDRNTKMKLYEANNVKYYLLANPDKQILESFELKDGSYAVKNDTDYELTKECFLDIDAKMLW